jgi:hypothetical protein
MDFNSNEKQCNNNASNYDSPVTENKLRTDPNHNFSNYIHTMRAASGGQMDRFWYQNSLNPLSLKEVMMILDRLRGSMIIYKKFTSADAIARRGKVYGEWAQILQ